MFSICSCFNTSDLFRPSVCQQMQCELPLTLISAQWHASQIPLVDLQMVGRLMARDPGTVLSLSNICLLLNRQAFCSSPSSPGSLTLWSDEVSVNSSLQDSLLASDSLIPPFIISGNFTAWLVEVIAPQFHCTTVNTLPSFLISVWLVCLCTSGNCNLE